MKDEPIPPSSPFVPQQTGFILHPSEVLGLLTHLVEKSLMVAEDQGGAARYHLLETIRQYALAKLSVSGKADAVRRRHAEYYMVLAETGRPFAFGSWTPEWVKRVAKEQDNLRAALTWSLSATGSVDLGLRLAGEYPGFW